MWRLIVIGFIFCALSCSLAEPAQAIASYKKVFDERYIKHSDDEAFKWYSIAAEGGFTTAQISLGKMYAVGFGAPQDNVQAHKWYNIAAMLEDYNAEFERDDLARMMSPEDIAKAEELATKWLASFNAAQQQ